MIRAFLLSILLSQRRTVSTDVPRESFRALLQSMNQTGAAFLLKPSTDRAIRLRTRVKYQIDWRSCLEHSSVGEAFAGVPDGSH
jgi:hypothetical protein